MKRKIIKIDKEKCNGCGLCAEACHEGAIGMVEGKAQLMREDYCDGLGDCLPVCPTGAISFEEREAAAYNEAEVRKNMGRATRLEQWPIQLRLVPVKAPYFEEADLLVCADCTAYAYTNFQNEFMRKRVTLIGCPKLDDAEYAGKLGAILSENEIRSVTTVRMEVPCCGGLEYAVKEALKRSGKRIPQQVVTITTDGKIKE